MSNFLGPIHHWLYHKIEWQESLTDRLARVAADRGWSPAPSAPPADRDVPLEEKIDMTDIHGWLQDRVRRAESRYAGLVTGLLARDPERLAVLETAARRFGADHPAGDLAGPQDVFRFFEDIFLDGMPCDRVNLVTRRDDDSLTWTRTRDLHGSFWAGGDPSVYYRLRSAALEGMMEHSGWTVDTGDGVTYTVARQAA